jgi:pyroglutamyl-peptidase
MTSILLTGFAPFGGETINPSWEAVRALDGALLPGGARIAARCLPCEFGAALTALRTAIAETRPAVVICVGQAGGRAELSLERIAINVDDARIADNAGRQPIDEAVVAGGPAAYFSTLPIKAMAAALRELGIPAAISQTAGTFVCNHVFYGLMHAASTEDRIGTIEAAGFIHIPYLPMQAALHAGAPSMALEVVVAGLRALAEVALNVKRDIRTAGGATH